MKQPNKKVILDLSKVNKLYDPIESARQRRPFDVFDSDIEERVSHTKRIMEEIESGNYAAVAYADENPGRGVTPTDYLQYYYPAFVNDLDRWYWTVDAYVTDGYSFPDGILDDLDDHLPPDAIRLQDLPAELIQTHEEPNFTSEELAGMDAEDIEFWESMGRPIDGTCTIYEPVTVYRASNTPPEDMPYSEYEYSWTLSLDKARWFKQHHTARFKTPDVYHVYKGKLRPNYAIAYTDERNEQEFIQVNSVYDIELVE